MVGYIDVGGSTRILPRWTKCGIIIIQTGKRYKFHLRYCLRVPFSLLLVSVIKRLYIINISIYMMDTTVFIAYLPSAATRCPQDVSFETYLEISLSPSATTYQQQRVLLNVYRILGFNAVIPEYILQIFVFLN